MKLVVDEPGSGEVRRTAKGADSLAAAGLAYVEWRSALARMREGGRLTQRAHDNAAADLDGIWADIASVSADDPLIEHAALLAERYLLRAYDAVHLAAALKVAAEAATCFACWDGDLRAAAESEGLDVAPL